MKTLPYIMALVASAPAAAWGHSQTDQTPRPSPEVQKLGYYVGSWHGHGDTKGGPFGRAGKLSSHMDCDWFAGKFQVICRGEETGPTGTRSFLNILAYDEAAKAYTEYSISNRGEAEYDRAGTLVGDRLTYIVSEQAGGKPVRFRYTEGSRPSG
jgi:hypothetical protein